MRKLELTISSCAECPYMEYDFGGDFSAEGAYCTKKSKQIYFANKIAVPLQQKCFDFIEPEYEIKRLNHNRTFDEAMIQDHRTLIPEWCPLPE